MAPAPKPVDFPAAARRHLADAKLLDAAGRLANAGHLYGFGAECGLKALLIWDGYPTDWEGSPDPNRRPNFKVHLHKLVLDATIASLKLFVDGRSGAKYLAMIPSIGEFSNWRVEHRYYSEAELPGSFQKWKAAAHEVGRMLDQALVDGKR